MNITTTTTTTTTSLDSKAHNNNNNTSFDGGFSLIFGLAIGCLSVISILAALATCFCTRKKAMFAVDAINANGGGSISTGDAIDQDHSFILEMGGLDEATLNSYPKLPYSQGKAKLEKGGDDGDIGGSIASSCSICLAEYKQHDMLRQLPDCDHLFHVQCIDPWLKMHPSCPVCRKLPFNLQGI